MRFARGCRQIVFLALTATLAASGAPQPAEAVAVCSKSVLAFGVYVAPATLVPDASGGVVVLDDVTSPADCPDVRIDADGAISTWPSAGAPVPLLHRWATPDGAGGLLAVWTDTAAGVPVLRGSRWNSAGDLQPGWITPTTSFADSHGTTSRVSMAPDGHGGAFLAWVDDENSEHRLRVQHVLGDGTTASPSGIEVCTIPAERELGSMIPDGADGAIVTWADGRVDGGPPGDVYAQRVNSALVPQWTAQGVAITSVSGSQQRLPALTPDGAGGAFIAWQDGRTGDWDIWLMRLTGGGVAAAAWPAGGIRVTTATTGQSNVAAVSDGAGGVYLAWSQGDPALASVFVMRLGSSGAPAAGWPAGGKPAGTEAGNSTMPLAVSDHAGGVRVAWQFISGATATGMLQTFAPNGSQPAGWPASGVTIGSATVFCYFGLESIADASDGTVFVAWATSCGGTTTRTHTVNVLHFGNDGLVGVTASFVSADVRPDAIRLEWDAGDVDPAAITLQRSDDGAAWIPRGDLSPGPGGSLVFVDREVVGGRSYAYRLAWSEAGGIVYSAEQRFVVPVAELALVGASPNPAGASVHVAFSLAAGGGPARLEIFDLAGRRRWSESVERLGAGRHVLRVPVDLPAGVYRLRLTQGSATREATAAVIR